MERFIISSRSPDDVNGFVTKGSIFTMIGSWIKIDPDRHNLVRRSPHVLLQQQHQTVEGDAHDTEQVHGAASLGT
jgi:hypothetical protein